ncbi:MAG TPA: glycosyltransferase family 4 protein [Solirubrobacteraceae bacterium]
MKVLCVNHTGLQSGAEIASIRLLTNLPDDVEPIVACPDGPFAQALRDHGISWRALPPTEASLSLSPANLARGCAGLTLGGLALRRIVGECRADLVHALTVRAGILASICGGRGSAPLVVTVQDVLPAHPISRVVARLLESRAAAIIVDSHYVKDRWLGRPDGGTPIDVVHPPGDPERFRPAQLDRAQSRAALGLQPDGPVLGIVGQITPWKGQDDAVRALHALRERFPSAELAVAGAVLFDSSRYDNHGFEASLHSLIAELGLADAVHMLGHRDDIPRVLASLDLLLVPSWEEPFGLVVVEAMSSGVPVFATNLGGPGEIITDGVDGLLLAPRSPEVWAREAARVLADRPLYEAMAAAGPASASRFSPGAHADATVAVYRRAVRPPSPATAHPGTDPATASAQAGSPTTRESSHAA